MSVPKIVDAHMHLGAPFTLFTHGWELRDVVGRMDRLHIDRGYSAHHFWLAGRFGEARAASIEAAEATGGRLPFLAVFDPRRESESLAAMDACLGHPYFIGIKIHPSFHGVSACDARYDAVWQYAAKYKLPIVTHSWSDTYNPVQKLSLPDLFEEHVRRHPGVSLILGHGGGPGNGQLQAIRLARGYPNVFLDTSGDVFSLDWIPNLVTAIGADRILFGSDQTWIDPAAHLTRIHFADIDAEAKAQILGGNALRIFEPHLAQGDNAC